MVINIQDGSNYFRGLLLLVGKDRRITEREHALMMRIGLSLGFEREFCDTAIREILENPFIAGDPPRFSSPAIAEKFIRDGLVLAGSDQNLHTEESEWLRLSAAANGLDPGWFLREEVRAAELRSSGDPHLEVESLTMK